MRHITKALAAAAVVTFGAGDTYAQSRIMPYQTAVNICKQFEGLIPPAPPIGTAKVGTFDAQTGEFVWDKSVTMRKFRERDPLTEVVDLGPVFDRYSIRAITPNLDPRVTSLPPGIRLAVASTVDDARIRQRPAGAARARPSAPARGAQGPIGPAGGRLTGRVLRGHPPDRLHRMYLPVQGGMQDLIFKVVNLPQGASFVVTSDNRTVSNAGSAQPDVVDIVVPARGWIRFKVEVKSGSPAISRSFGEIVAFDRPPNLGCFTIEALPVAVAYEPPGSGSSQTYTTAQHVGNVIKSFSGTENSSTLPVATAFSTVGDMIGILGGVGQAVSGAASVIPALAPMAAVGQGLQAASSILGAAWGSSETTETNSYSVTDEHTLEVNTSNTAAIETSAHLGPGKGDVIQFLRKPVFAWLAATDFQTGELFLTVSLLGFETIATHSAADLRSPTLTVVSAAAKKLLLALDPLTPEYKEAHPTPEPGRLVWFPYSTSFSGSGQPMSYERTITESDIRTETTSRNVTTTEVGGVLSYLATNVPQTGTTSMTTTHGGTKGVSVGSTVKVDVTLASAVGEYYDFNTYFDRKFGTFGFQEVPVGGIVVAGMVASEAGAPRPGTRVEIVTAGRKFITWTDPQGRYAFRSRRLKPGSYELVVEGKRQPLRLEGKRVTADVTVSQRAEVRDSGALGRKPGAERLEVRPRRK